MKDTTRKIIAALFLIALSLAPVFAIEFTADEALRMRSAVVSEARQYIGFSYRTGAAGPDAFDCSGLIFRVMMDAAGVPIPRTVSAIYSQSQLIGFAEIEIGDLVFFKTTGDGSVSHAGIYIGRKQFIHAASDGANTGVIVSSLDERYYANAFAGVGRILPSAIEPTSSQSEPAAYDEADTAPKVMPPISPQELEQNTRQQNIEPQQGEEPQDAEKADGQDSGKWYSKVIFDGSFFVDWNFFYPDHLEFNWRGFAFETNARYKGKYLQPGVGFVLRYNKGTENFQVPIVFSITVKEYIKFYAGPVIHFGDPKVAGSDTAIKGSFFPGIMGVSLQTPSFKIGKVGLALVQDIQYTIYNNTTGGALPFKETVGTGLVFSSGVRVTLPMNRFLK